MKNHMKRLSLRFLLCEIALIAAALPGIGLFFGWSDHLRFFWLEMLLIGVSMSAVCVAIAAVFARRAMLTALLVGPALSACFLYIWVEYVFHLKFELPRVLPQTSPPVLAVGQPWATAQSITQEAGYSLHDAAELQMEPPLDGFYIELPKDQGLIVLRDTRTNVVEAIEPYVNWSEGKHSKAQPPPKTYRLPPAE